MRQLLRYVAGLLLLLGNTAFSQNLEDLNDINVQIWNNFTKSFETQDYELFESLHTDDLIRVNGGDYTSIQGKTGYLDGYKKRWNSGKLNETISFRFLERISKDGMASERGIYKFTRSPGTENEKSYYGKFHVILKKIDKRWKILVDYDSTENKTINEASYSNAHSMIDFGKY